MRVLEVLGLAGLACLAACSAEPSWVPIDHSPLAAVAPATVDDHAVTCLLDSGLDISLLKNTEGRWVDEGVEAELVISGLERDARLVAHRLVDPIFDSLAPILPEIDCILGWDLLGDHPVTLDHRLARVRIEEMGLELEADPTLGEAVWIPLEDTSPYALVRATVQGVEVRLVVDTGATAVHLMPDVFARLPEPPPTYDRTVWTPNGEHLTQAGVLEDLSVGETTFSDVDFTTSDLEAISELRAAGVDVDGLLGNSVLLRGVSTLYGWQGDLVIQPYPADVQAELMETLRGG